MNFILFLHYIFDFVLLLPLNIYNSMYARTNRCYNEWHCRKNYVRSSIPHCTLYFSQYHSKVLQLAEYMHIQMTNTEQIQNYFR
jgi:hypothetical protein